MKPSAAFHKPLSKYGAKHLPLHIYIWIQKAGLTKTEFFEQYPNYHYRDEGFPQVLIDRIQERKEARKENLKKAERDLERSIGKLSLKCGCNKDAKRPCKQGLPKVKSLRKKVEFQPSTSRVGRAIARVKPVVRQPSPVPIIDITSDSDSEPISVEVAPRVDLLPPSGVELFPQASVEAISHPGHSREDLPPPSVEIIPPPSVAPNVELLPSPSVEVISQVTE